MVIQNAAAVSGSVQAKLFGTKACHLCEEAGEILRKARVAAVHIDITEDDGLFQRYGLRIPVLQRLDSNAELDWPFDVASASRFLMRAAPSRNRAINTLQP